MRSHSGSNICGVFQLHWRQRSWPLICSAWLDYTGERDVTVNVLGECFWLMNRRNHKIYEAEGYMLCGAVNPAHKWKTSSPSASIQGIDFVPGIKVKMHRTWIWCRNKSASILYDWYWCVGMCYLYTVTVPGLLHTHTKSQVIVCKSSNSMLAYRIVEFDIMLCVYCFNRWLNRWLH